MSHFISRWVFLRFITLPFCLYLSNFFSFRLILRFHSFTVLRFHGSTVPMVSYFFFSFVSFLCRSVLTSFSFRLDLWFHSSTVPQMSHFQMSLLSLPFCLYCSNVFSFRCLANWDLRPNNFYNRSTSSKINYFQFVTNLYRIEIKFLFTLK